MKNTAKLAVICCAVLSSVLSGCGGREAHPISTTNLGDANLDCASINREIIANNENIRQTLHEKHMGEIKNTALGVGGLVFFPVWFFMDPKSPEKKEINAYQVRNEVLANLAAQKKCHIQAPLRFTNTNPAAARAN